jgi:hypothetical protein
MELHTLYSSNTVNDDQIKMGRAYCVHGRDEKCMQKFSWKIVRGDPTWET